MKSIVILCLKSGVEHPLWYPRIAWLERIVTSGRQQRNVLQLIMMLPLIYLAPHITSPHYYINKHYISNSLNSGGEIHNWSPAMQNEIQCWQCQSSKWMDSMLCIVLKINDSTCITKNPLNSYSMVNAGISGVALRKCILDREWHVQVKRNAFSL